MKICTPFAAVLLIAAFTSCGGSKGEGTGVGGDTVSIEGTWQGTLSAGGAELRFVFRITAAADGGWTATAESPDQGVTGITVESVTLDGSKVRISVPATAGVYEGRIDPETGEIKGSWKQGGGAYTLDLKRVAAVEQVSRPQDPSPPYPYRSEDVLFPNRSAGFELAGTVTIPEGGGAFPAVVLVSGSGAQNRDEEIMNHRPFLVIADHLTRNGIAVLRYDDRGVGGSGGDAASATTADIAVDAWSAVEYLMGRSEIDASRIGIAGHSEGGLIASILAAEHPEIAFIVLLAAPGLPGDELLLLQNAAIMKASGISDAQAEVLNGVNARIYRVLKEEPDDEKAHEAIAGELKGIGMTGAQVEGQIDALLSPWYRYFVAYDPRPDLERVSCPVLAVGGSLDLQVPPESNIPEITGALERGGNSRVTVSVFQGLNHLFQHASTGLVQEYGLIDETVSPDVLSLLSDWITAAVTEGR